MLLFQNRVTAVFLAAAVLALETGPDGVKLVHGGFHQLRIIGEDARLEITGTRTLHTYAGASKIGAADVC